MAIRATRLALGAIGACLVMMQGSPAAQAGWEPDPAFGLGQAAQYAVLSLGKPSAETDGQSRLDLSAVTVYGNVGVGPYGTLDFQGPSTIVGDLYLDPTLLPQDIISDVGTVTGARLYDQDLSGPVADAIAAAQANAALPPTQSVGRLLASTTLYGNGGLNVIAIDGVDYSRSNPTTPLTLELVGGENDLFVLNVSGKFVLGPNASIRAPDPSRLLINVLPGSVPVQFASNSFVGGTLLATSRKMGPLQGACGPVIGALVSEISLLGGAVLNPPPMVPLAVIVADQQVTIGTPAQLDGSASTAPFGEPLTYHWTLLEAPSGSAAQLSDPAIVNPYFIPDLAGAYVVQLVVNGGELTSEPALATIVAQEPSAGADLALNITDYPDPVVRKQPLVYTLTLRNQGTSTATDTILVATFDGSVRGTPTVSPAEFCGFSAAAEITCLLGDLPSQGEVAVELTATPKEPGVFSVSGTASTSAADASPDDNSDYEETLVLKR